MKMPKQGAKEQKKSVPDRRPTPAHSAEDPDASTGTSASYFSNMGDTRQDGSRVQSKRQADSDGSSSDSGQQAFKSTGFVSDSRIRPAKVISTAQGRPSTHGSAEAAESGSYAAGTRTHVSTQSSDGDASAENGQTAIQTGAFSDGLSGSSVERVRGPYASTVGDAVQTLITNCPVRTNINFIRTPVAVSASPPRSSRSHVSGRPETVLETSPATRTMIAPARTAAATLASLRTAPSSGSVTNIRKRSAAESTCEESRLSATANTEHFNSAAKSVGNDQDETSLQDLPSLATGMRNSTQAAVDASTIETEKMESHPTGQFGYDASDSVTMFPRDIMPARTVAPALDPTSRVEAAQAEVLTAQHAIEAEVAQPAEVSVAFQTGITRASNESASDNVISPQRFNRQQAIVVGSKLVAAVPLCFRSAEVIDGPDTIQRDIPVDEGLVVEAVGTNVSGRLKVRSMLDGQVGWISAFQSGNYDRKLVKVAQDAAEKIRVESPLSRIHGVYLLERCDEFGCPVYQKRMDNVTLAFKRDDEGTGWNFSDDADICSITTNAWKPTAILETDLRPCGIACIAPFGAKSRNAGKSGGDALFIDPGFPPVYSSIDNMHTPSSEDLGKYVWERVENLLPDQELDLFVYEREGQAVPHPDDVHQGAAEDSWWLAGIASMSERVGLISKMFLDGAQLKGDGSCRIRLFSPLTQQFVVMTIDTMIPCTRSKDGVLEPAFAKFSRALIPREGIEAPRRRAYWPLLLEKAAAKYVRSYVNLTGGVVTTAFQMCGCGDSQDIWVKYGKQHCHPKVKEPHFDRLTLSPEEQQDVLKQRVAGDARVVPINLSAFYFSNGYHPQAELHEEMRRAKDSLLSARSVRSGQGIQRGVAYSILQVVSVTSKRDRFDFVQLRSPWGSTWQGPWHDEDPRWEKHPIVQRCLEPKAGTFFMLSADFFTYFSAVFVSRLVDREELAFVKRVHHQVPLEARRKSRISCFLPNMRESQVSPKIVFDMMKEVTLTSAKREPSGNRNGA